MLVAPLAMFVASLAVAAIALSLARRLRNGAREAHVDVDELPMAYYHARAVCVGPCPIHAPSEHHMVGWAKSFHPDRGIFERKCPCGRWHPDPDSIEYFRRVSGEHTAWGLGVHGCACRCCVSGGGAALPVR
jgi:hypothetical protein